MTLTSQAATAANSSLHQTLHEVLYAAFATDLRYPLLVIAAGLVLTLVALRIGEAREQRHEEQAAEDAAQAQRAAERMRPTLIRPRPAMGPATPLRATKPIHGTDTPTRVYEPGYRAS
jgi:type II secretory pathway pseudopilin PulG